MIQLFFLLLVWTITLPQAATGGEKENLNPKVTLPAEVAGWKWDGKDLRYNSRTLFDYIDGAAELYLAYGFQNLGVRRYEKTSRLSVVVELYEMASPEDAYGVFSFERQEDSAGIGQGSEFGGGLLRFWKAKYFVSVYAEGDGPEVEPVILSAGRAAADSIPGTGAEPRLIQFLPGRDFGLVEKSIRYLKSHVLLNQRFFVSHQNILNLNRDSEAVLAQYLREREKVSLLLIRYPSQAKAEEVLQNFTRAYLADASGKGRVRTEDRKWTFARQVKENIIIVFGAPREADGEALLRAAEDKISGRR